MQLPCTARPWQEHRPCVVRSTSRTSQHHELARKPVLTLSPRYSMICDYFFPKVGGVESHIYSLASALAQLDHKARLSSTTRPSILVLVLTSLRLNTGSNHHPRLPTKKWHPLPPLRHQSVPHPRPPSPTNPRSRDLTRILHRLTLRSQHSPPRTNRRVACSCFAQCRRHGGHLPCSNVGSQGCFHGSFVVWVRQHGGDLGKQDVEGLFE